MALPPLTATYWFGLALLFIGLFLTALVLSLLLTQVEKLLELDTKSQKM